MTLYAIAAYSEENRYQNEPCVIKMQNREIIVFHARSYTELQNFDLNSSRLFVTPGEICIECNNGQKFSLRGQDNSKLARFLQHYESYVYHGSFNSERCSILFKHDCLLIPEFQRSIELKTNDVLVAASPLLTLKRDGNEIELRLDDQNAFIACSVITQFIIAQMSVVPASSSAAYPGTSKTELTQRKLDIKLETVKGTAMLVELLHADNAVFAFIKKGMRVEQQILAAVREIDATVEFVKFQLLPNDDIFVDTPEVYERIKNFCGLKVEGEPKFETDNYGNKGFLPEDSCKIEDLAPMLEEIESSLAFLQNLKFSDERGGIFLVKFAFPQGAPYITIGNQQTIEFEGIKVHADLVTNVIFEFEGFSDRALASRKEYQQMAECIHLIDGAIRRGVDVANITTDKKQAVEAEMRLQKARQETISYREVFSSLNAAIEVQTTDSKQKFTINFSTDGLEVLMNVFQAGKQIISDVVVEDIICISENRDRAEFRILPFPNILAASSSVFFELFTAWREFKGDMPEVDIE